MIVPLQCTESIIQPEEGLATRCVPLQHCDKSRDADGASTMRADTIRRVSSEFDYRPRRQERGQRTVIRSRASYDTVSPCCAAADQAAAPESFAATTRLLLLDDKAFGSVYPAKKRPCGRYHVNHQ